MNQQIELAICNRKLLACYNFLKKKFGTEKTCQKQLFRLRWPEGFKYPRCNHAEAYDVNNLLNDLERYLSFGKYQADLLDSSFLKAYDNH